jgi:hypothetical protein
VLGASVVVVCGGSVVVVSGAAVLVEGPGDVGQSIENVVKLHYFVYKV